MAASYLGEFVAFATTLSWSFGILPFTEAARRLGPNSLNHYRLLLAVVFLTAISIIFIPLSFSQLFKSPLPVHWLWFGTSGIVGLTLGDYFAFTSYAILGSRMGSIFMTLSPAAALIAAYFIIGERINYVGIIGIVITIGGVIWLTLSRSGKAAIPIVEQHGKLERGILAGILSAICQGVGLVLANKGFQSKVNHSTLPFFQATWIRMICATTCIFLVTMIRGRLKNVSEPVFKNNNKGNIFMLAGTLFGPVTGVSLSMLTVSILGDKPSVAQTIFSLVPVFVLPLSHFFYKEKITLKSLLGSLIAIAGVMILIWREALLRLF